MASRVLQGDVFAVLPTLPAGSVDCVVTSPPYWMLRSYLPKDHALKHLELGSERTPGEYVASMVRVFEEVKRVLADHGTVWLNIGDSYSAKPVGNFNGGSSLLKGRDLSGHSEGNKTDKTLSGIEEKNLCLIPQRLMIALQDAGWIVRSIVIWHKPACMPASLSGWQWRRCRVKVRSNSNKGKNAESPNRTAVGFNERYKESAANAHFGAPQSALVGHSGNELPNRALWKDCPGCKKCEPAGGYVLRKGSWRPTSSYEPVIMIAKSSRYFADGEPVKTAPAAATVSRDQYTRVLDDPDEQFAVAHDHETLCDGANLRDVWTIAAEPLKEKHYAAFPTALVEKCLRAGTSAKGYCPECGMPWARMIESEKHFESGSGKSGNAPVGKNGVKLQGGGDTGDVRNGPILATKTIGWRATCPHRDLDPRPGVVLDPFGGSGRTAITAQQLGLDSISIELNPEYAEMARRLIRADSPLFAGCEAA